MLQILQTYHVGSRVDGPPQASGLIIVVKEHLIVNPMKCPKNAYVLREA